ncbi:hypothetical protein QJS04_geneDACA013817 [Acorus gramineus]|uniref:Uncharacterized protein n=1 Tax=Acorus gramineus TaxID=55184 RepID=A0AAV9AZU5_ACOGR|nr:hypothetical protein QJS04_geneDACA013817 [Acorus gramineus]
MAEKQKVVMKIPMNGQKNNTKALQAVTKAKGVFSVGLEGDDKSQVVVIGEGMDCVDLKKLIQKKLGGWMWFLKNKVHVEIVTVSAVKEKEKEKEADKKIEVVPYHCPQPGVVTRYVYDDPCYYRDPWSIW